MRSSYWALSCAYTPYAMAWIRLSRAVCERTYAGLLDE